ncbi:EAL domain-containing protein [Methylomarinum sp. Ch1-1]|uniref:cyclic-guanylate-specific phosphodiesterase n=1 Tax=Methylomarinum roseum TaxID=3067653 RepID=A0AAU7NR70_9GAMM
MNVERKNYSARLRIIPWILASIILLGGFAITAHVWRNIKQDDFEKLQAEFEFSADMAANNILNRVHSYAMVMRGVKGFYEGSERVSLDEFRDFVRALELRHQSGVQGVGLVKIVAKDEKIHHVAEMRRNGRPDYQLKPVGERPVYAPIIHMEPMNDDNLKVLGFDVLTAPPAKAAMERARDSGDIAITSRITLIQDAGKPGVYGFVMYLPMYRKGANPDSVIARREAIVAWVDVPFRMNDLMAGLSGLVDPGIEIEIHDGAPRSGLSLMYRSGAIGETANQDENSLTTRRRLDIGGRHWALLMRTTPVFEARISNRQRSVMAALFGVVLTLSLAWIAWLLARRHAFARLRYRELFDQAGDGVLLVSRDFHFIDANAVALQMLGYTREELMKRRLPDILARNELPLLQPAADQSMGGKPHLQEWSYRRKDGSESMAEVNVRWLDNDCHLAILRDLSERKKTERQIRRLSELYRALSEMNQAIIRMDDESELLPLVCRCAVDFGNMKMAWVGHLDAKRSDIAPAEAYGSGVGFLHGLRLSVNGDLDEGCGPAGTALRENRSVIVNDCLSDPMTRCWRSRAQRFGFGSSASFPIQRSGQSYAVLNVYHGQKEAFDEQTTALLREMAVDISFALDNFDREDQRQQLAKDLDKAYQRITHIIDINPAIIYSLSVRNLMQCDFRVDFVSANAQRVTGYSHEDLHRRDFWRDHVHPDDLSTVLQAQQHLFETGLLNHQYRFRHADGHYLWIEDQLLVNRDENGDPSGIVGAWLNITQAKQTEEELLLRKELLLESQRIAKIGSWRVDIPSGRLTWSHETYRLYQVSPDEFEHSFDAFLQLLPVEERTAMRTWIDKYLEGKTPSKLEFKIVMPDGGVRFIEAQGEFKHDHCGEVVALQGTMQDITERVAAEQQLRLNAKVFESSREGIVITDADNNIVSVNRAYAEISGYSAEEAIGMTPRLVSSGKQDQSFYQAMWRDIIDRGHWQGEVVNRRKNGELYPQWISINVIRDQGGKITHHVGILSDLTEYKAAEERIQFLSHFDPLTHLPNRTLLRDRTQLALAAAHRAGHQVVMMCLDIDRFKIINDSLGPQIGDQLIKKLSVRLTSHLHPDDTLSRQGGDEFILLLPETNAEGAAHVAQKVLTQVALPFVINDHSLTLTASIGIAEYPQDGENFEQLMQSADAALFRAKENGRNNFQFFTRQLHDHAKHVLEIENELRQALEKGELRLYYQPQVDVESWRIIGAEALIRWRHHSKGMLSPGLFIPVAEESGLISEIGDWVLLEAVRQIADWQAAGLPIVPVAINISVAQFRQDALYQKVVQALRDYKLDPSMLELEMTEGIAMDSSGRTTGMLDQFNALGVKLSIDDFGTGYSSLSYLKRYKIDKLKIDQSFIRDLCFDPDDEAIVTAIIGMANSLGFKVVAEGVETREQLEYLKHKQCDEVQGYFFSKPVPAEAFAELLRVGKISKCE